ncbi:MAG: hypothetical protein PQJ58_00835 [Spirochaetales bacterium]|nr:hypothetical protein [Spirochaetales bacterium]
MMKAPIKYIALTVFLLITQALTAMESPFDFKVKFSDTVKFKDWQLDQNIIDTFEFEGWVHWTENTELYARLKLDNFSESFGGILFGSTLDQRYGMSNDQLLDKSYVRTNLLKETGRESAPDLLLLAGYNAGGVLHEEWTAFDFENYRLGGIQGVVLQGDYQIWQQLYITGAFNPALGSSNLVWTGINDAKSSYPDILTAFSWRTEAGWAELYWDSYANSNASFQGSDLQVLGGASYYELDFPGSVQIRISDRLEYGFNRSASRKDHMRLAMAGGVQLPLLYGLSSNLSFNGFYLDRHEMNLGMDNELMVTETLGTFLALGGIRLGDDPDFVYEAGLSGHFNFLSLYIGYSDHKGGNEGWFSGAFDTTRESEASFFFRLDVEY